MTTEMQWNDRFMELMRAIHGAVPDSVNDSARLAFAQTLKEFASAPPASQDAPARALPESMSRDEMLKYYSGYANLCAHEAILYQRRIRELEAVLSAQAAPPDYPPRLADEVERELALMIDRCPEPLRRLSDWLANKLDEDDWKTAERMLLGAVESVADRVQLHQVKKGEPS